MTILDNLTIEQLEKRIQDGETYLRVRAILKEYRTDDDQRTLLRFQIARRMYDIDLDKKPSAEEYLDILRELLLSAKIKAHLQGLADGTIADTLGGRLAAQMNATEYGVVGPPNTDGDSHE